MRASRRRPGRLWLWIALLTAALTAGGISTWFLVGPASPNAGSTPLNGNPEAPSRYQALPGVVASPATMKQTVAGSQARYLVLIILDGARPDYFNVPNIPHLRALIKNGTSFNNAFAGILESETPAGHATIASGSMPKNDGILSFAWANSDNTTVNLFNPNNILNGQMERIMQQAPANDISGLVHKQYPSAKVVALGGHKYYAQDALGGSSADAIMYYTGTSKGTFAPIAVPGHMPPKAVLSTPGLIAGSTHLPLGTEDHMAMHLARATFQHMHPKVLMMNLPEFDWPLGHVDGGSRDPSGVRTLMQGADQDLGKLEDLYRKAGILDQTLFVVTADHGFAPIYHKVDKNVIDQAVASAGGTIVSDTYHTASYIWLTDDSRAPASALAISRLQNPYIQSVYFKEVRPGGSYDYIRASDPGKFLDPATEKANQYLLSTFAGPEGPDLVVFLTEDTAGLPGGQATWKGDHGGSDWESQHLPMIFSGPGVRQGVVSSAPAPLMDLAPTALTLMGIQHQGMQGIPLADAIRSANPSLKSTSSIQAKALLPVITALQNESRLELEKAL